MIRQYIVIGILFFFDKKSKLNAFYLAIFIFIIIIRIDCNHSSCVISFKVEWLKFAEILSLPYILDFVNFNNYLIFLIIIFLYLKIFLFP